MKHLYSKLAILTLTAASLFAVDATGTWTGTLKTSEGNEQPARMELKQEGDNLTGTAGPSAGEQHPIKKGKVENSKLTFEIARENGPGMKFALQIEGDEITGEVTRQREGGTRTAKVHLKREK